ncbi:MAG: Holliday junction branch migration protein RuvA [Pseudomonadota bacterium]
MIAHLRGILIKKTTHSVIIDNGGIGYEATVPLSTFYVLPERDEEVSLHIYTHVREDALSLFGFKTALEKEIFMMLISVSGIGPKLAVNILSGIGPEDLIRAIAYGDTLRLQAIPGLGKKTAERIVLELREKASKLSGDLTSIPHPAITMEEKRIRDDALSALLNLGYPSKPARHAIEKAVSRIEEGDLEGLIKESLKLLVQ